MGNSNDIELCIWTETDQALTLADAREMSRDEFAKLSSTISDRGADVRRGEESEHLLICAFCKQPVYFSFAGNQYARGVQTLRHSQGNRDACVSARRPLSQESLRALKWQGNQEGPDHERLRLHIRDLLMRDPEVSGVQSERIVRGKVLEHEYRRPDVTCLWRGRRIVFEVQLSNTFVTDVADRRTFYRHEGITLIWVYWRPDFATALVGVEFRRNRHNLFSVSDESEAASKEFGQLRLTCQHDSVSGIGARATAALSTRNVGLADLIYDGVDAYLVDGPALLEQKREEKPPPPTRFVGQTGNVALEGSVHRGWRRDALEALVADAVANPEILSVDAAGRIAELLPDPSLGVILRKVYRRGGWEFRKLLSVALNGILISRLASPYAIFASMTLGGGSNKYTTGLAAAEIAEAYRPAWTPKNRAKAEAFLAEARAAPQGVLYRELPDVLFLAMALLPKSAVGIAALDLRLVKDAQWLQWRTGGQEQAAAAVEHCAKRAPGIDWTTLRERLAAAGADQRDIERTLVLAGASVGASPSTIKDFAERCGLVRTLTYQERR